MGYVGEENNTGSVKDINTITWEGRAGRNTKKSEVIKHFSVENNLYIRPQHLRAKCWKLPLDYFWFKNKQPPTNTQEFCLMTVLWIQGHVRSFVLSKETEFFCEATSSWTLFLDLRPSCATRSKWSFILWVHTGPRYLLTLLRHGFRESKLSFPGFPLLVRTSGPSPGCCRHWRSSSRLKREKIKLIKNKLKINGNVGYEACQDYLLLNTRKV